METHNAAALEQAFRDGGHGQAPVFVQDNHSCSHAGVLRGLHYQRDPAAQGRLVRVTRGRAWDVVVDLRHGSPTFGRWHAITLDEDNALQVWIPPGLAHGFLAMSDHTEVLYKVTVHRVPALERSLRWDDPRLGIAWPLAPGQAPVLSVKDAHAPAWNGAGLEPG